MNTSKLATSEIRIDHLARPGCAASLGIDRFQEETQATRSSKLKLEREQKSGSASYLTWRQMHRTGMTFWKTRRGTSAGLYGRLGSMMESPMTYS
jgi:hypothetical protein